VISPSLFPPASPVPPWLKILRFLPEWFPGKWRLSHALIERVRLEGPVEIESGGLRWRVPSIKEPIALGLIASGVYDPATCAVIQKALPCHGTFLDVGANVGIMTVKAGVQWCPEGHVIGFEASPRIHAWLKGNLCLNGLEQVTVLNRAVTERSGDFMTFFDAPDAKFGMGSLANRFGSAEQHVESICLDDAVSQAGVSHVDVIKVDVEGFELGVFRGARRILSQSRPPLIVFEFNDWAEEQPELHQRAGDAQRFLLECGYKLQTVGSFLAGGRPHESVLIQGGADLVATREH